MHITRAQVPDVLQPEQERAQEFELLLNWFQVGPPYLLHALTLFCMFGRYIYQYEVDAQQTVIVSSIAIAVTTTSRSNTVLDALDSMSSNCGMTTAVNKAKAVAVEVWALAMRRPEEVSAVCGRYCWPSNMLCRSL